MIKSVYQVSAPEARGEGEGRVKIGEWSVEIRDVGAAPCGRPRTGMQIVPWAATRGRPYGEDRGDSEKRYNVILRSDSDEESFRSRVRKILRPQNDRGKDGRTQKAPGWTAWRFP